MTREEFCNLEIGTQVILDGTLDDGEFDNCPAVVVELDRDPSYDDECSVLFEYERNGVFQTWWVEYFDAENVHFRSINRRKTSGLTEFLERTK